ncbi:NAD(P)-binding protein [Archangium violaceum]|uniref:NAD(P)-binding protein n=1 Tax=Archangium violaceum TaxID=83451 RepID=UPI00193C7C2A|nr:NAD(P)-binding protein [Archangium violaceum]QRK04552.1 NAD(P)-binding protein [Archangium violaceum]
MAKRVVIAGGGLAGLTCAKYLVDEGFSVTLLLLRQSGGRRPGRQGLRGGGAAIGFRSATLSRRA